MSEIEMESPVDDEKILIQAHDLLTGVGFGDEAADDILADSGGGLAAAIERYQEYIDHPDTRIDIKTERLKLNALLQVQEMLAQKL